MIIHTLLGEQDQPVGHKSVYPNNGFATGFATLKVMDFFKVGAGVGIEVGAVVGFKEILGTVVGAIV